MTVYLCLWSQLPTVVTVLKLNQKHWNTLRFSSASMPTDDSVIYSYLRLPCATINFPFAIAICLLILPYRVFSHQTLLTLSAHPGRDSLVADEEIPPLKSVALQTFSPINSFPDGSEMKHPPLDFLNYYCWNLCYLLAQRLAVLFTTNKTQQLIPMKTHIISTFLPHNT